MCVHLWSQSHFQTLLWLSFCALDSDHGLPGFSARCSWLGIAASPALQVSIVSRDALEEVRVCGFNRNVTCATHRAACATDAGIACDAVCIGRLPSCMHACMHAYMKRRVSCARHCASRSMRFFHHAVSVSPVDGAPLLHCSSIWVCLGGMPR